VVTVALLWIAWTFQAPPDSAARAHLTAQLRAVTDSLSVLTGAAARYRRDADKASGALMVARAAEVRAGCTGALAAVDSLTTTLGARRYLPRDAQSQGALQVDLATLRQSLRTCRREWDTAGPHGARADSVRAWGPFRLAALERVVRKYEERAGEFREHFQTAKAPASR
jgi:hypothetical protein